MSPQEMQAREKHWQVIAGRMAVIANWMYHHVSEKNMSETELEECHDKFREILQYLEFDETEE